MPALNMLLWYASWLALLGVCAFALLKGGRAERAGAIVLLGFALVAGIGQVVMPIEARPTMFLVLDGLTALGLVILVVRYASFWLGAAMTLQSAQFSLHAYYFVTERSEDTLFRVLNNLNFLAILVCLALGTYAVAARRGSALNRAI